MDASIGSHSDAAVLERVRECLDKGREGVLVTLISVDGSAYRRPGARQLLEADGTATGTIVPGCLDAELRRTASAVRETGAPTTVTVDLSDGESWGVGVGCDGTVELLVEPIDWRLNAPVDALAADRPVAMATILDSESVSVGEHAVFEETGSLVGGELPSWLHTIVSETVSDSDDRTSDTVTVDGPEGTVELFVDWFVPSPRLVVFGTGPDVGPLVESARLAGFSPIVVGFRGEVDADRFPEASTVVSSRPADIREAIDVDADTAAVVATHNFVDDRLIVEQLVPTPAPYVGVVGSRERFERLLGQCDIDLSAADRERLYSPAGLDLGGETPAQIALSIVGEVLAVYNDRKPEHLRDRSKPIHERSSGERDCPQQ